MGMSVRGPKAIFQEGIIMITLQRLVSVALVSIVIQTIAWADNLPSAKPKDVGLSQSRLDRITKAMNNDVESGELRGALAMVARNGKVAYLETAGMADTENDVPMSDDTIFRIYSMSKPITSVAVMMLFEEGRFFLKDPVSKYLPELENLSVIVEEEIEEDAPVFNIPDEAPNNRPATSPSLAGLKTVPAKREMTVQDLLRHTAGLTYGFFGNSQVDKLYTQSGILTTDKNIAETVEKLSKLPLKHQPGEVWEYSVAVDVLGRFVEVVADQPFDEFLQERIFEPLGMDDTGFYVPDDKLHRFAQLYSPAREGKGVVPAAPFLSRRFVNNPTLHSGGGGLVSTAADYFRFCQMLLNGGELDGARILSRKTIELMTADHTRDIPIAMRARGYGFGLGFAVAEDIGRAGIPTSPGEYNWGGAAGTKFWIDPEEQFIGIYMVQILPHTGLNFGNKFKILAYQSIAD